MLLFCIVLSWFLVGFLCCLLMQYLEYKFDSKYCEYDFKPKIYIKASIVGYLFILILAIDIIFKYTSILSSKYKDFMSKPLFKFK